jgi:hypothetical protein
LLPGSRWIVILDVKVLWPHPILDFRVKVTGNAGVLKMYPGLKLRGLSAPSESRTTVLGLGPVLAGLTTRT